MKHTLFVMGVYILLAAVVFGKLPQTFFQQDEWAIFGHIMASDGTRLSLFERLFIYEQDTHLVPFTNALTILQYRLFGLHFAAYAITSIAFQILNAFLVFVLARVLIKKNWVALMAGGIFLINSISHQAITWIATAAGTAGSTTVLLFALISFAKYLSSGERAPRFLWAALILFLVSLGFKETSIFVFLFFPLFWLIFSKKRDTRGAIKIVLPLGILGILYVLLRLYFFSILSPNVMSQSELAQPPIVVYLFRVVAMPVRVLAQSFVPVSFILKGARVLVTLAYPHFVTDHTPDPYVVESVASDILSFFIFCAILLARYFVINRLQRKNENLTRLFDVSLVFIALGALPFIVVPGKAGYLSLIDGRHLYLTGIFSSILAALGLYGLFLWSAQKKLGMFIVIVLFGLVGTYHILKIRRDIEYQVVLGRIRLAILHQITARYPTLPTRVVFYVTSDTPYYGLPYEEPIVPFQSGFGQTLLVWYNAHGGDLPACLFEKKYLYVLLSEDFKECQGQGFGYFRKKEIFNQAVRTYTIQPEEVIAFRFTSSTNTLDDVTGEVRDRLKRFGKL